MMGKIKAIARGKAGVDKPNNFGAAKDEVRPAQAQRQGSENRALRLLKPATDFEMKTGKLSKLNIQRIKACKPVKRLSVSEVKMRTGNRRERRRI